MALDQLSVGQFRHWRTHSRRLQRHATFVEGWLLGRGLNPAECSEEDFQKAMAAASDQPKLDEPAPVNIADNDFERSMRDANPNWQNAQVPFTDVDGRLIDPITDMFTPRADLPKEVRDWLIGSGPLSRTFGKY